MGKVAMQNLFGQGIDYLNDKGLNLVGVLDIPTLPDSIREPLLAADLPLQEFSRLVVVGHAGQRMWQVLAPERGNSMDPVDDFSKRHSSYFAENYLNDASWQLLYPADLFFPLNELGELVGWGKPSPLGLGIHPQYGLWWAYRTVFLTKTELPLTQPAGHAHPCDSCLGKPCITICSATALDTTSGFNVYACADYRIESDSKCGQQCLARLACPVGAEHRYKREQINYHYSLSLATIKAYKAGEL